MELLIQTALTFPAIIFIALLGFVILYWLLVAIGLAPIELFEHDSLRDNHLASTLISLGLGGVPATFALTILLLFSTVACLLIELLVLRYLPLGGFRAPLGIVIIWAAVAVSTPLCIATCQALRRFFHPYRNTAPRSLLGQVVVVLESTDEQERRGHLADDPAEVLCLRDKDNTPPHAGERRVLVKYLADDNAYRSVAEQEFLDAHVRLSKLRLARKHKRSNSSGGDSNNRGRHNNDNGRHATL